MQSALPALASRLAGAMNRVLASRAAVRPRGQAEPRPARLAAVLTQHGGWSAPYSDYVCGTLRNCSGETLPSVAVRIAFLDEAGNELDRTTATTAALGPGRRWSFRAAAPGVDAAAYEIAGIAADGRHFALASGLLA